MCTSAEVGPSTGEWNANQFKPTHSVAEELYSLLDAVDSESIADDFKIGIHSKKHDLTLVNRLT